MGAAPRQPACPVQSAGCTPANLAPAQSSSCMSVMVFQNIKTDVEGGSCLTGEGEAYGCMK